MSGGKRHHITQDPQTFNIGRKELTLAEARGKITTMSGKVGSSHWPIDGQAAGSWDLRVYDADRWENHRVQPDRPRTAGALRETPPQTPPRRQSNNTATSDHSIIQHLTPEAQERFRHHVNELQTQKSENRRLASSSESRARFEQ